MTNYKDYRAKDFALDENFQKWVSGTDDTSSSFWDSFLKDHPEKKPELEKAARMVRMAGLTEDADANKVFLEVWGNLNKHAKANPGAPSKMKFIWYAAIAASIIGIIVVGRYFFNEPAYNLEYRTAFAEIKKVSLTDGSVVTLNSNSILKVASDFSNGNDREVFLEGEAFFEVAKKTGSAFNVKTSTDMGVQVLGTEFNVKTRRESIFVYLQSGKVRLTSHSEDLTLKPGETAKFNKSSRKVSIDKHSLTHEMETLAWKENLFIMNDTPLSTICNHIEDNFGVKVILKDPSLSDRRVTAKAPALDLGILLKILSETLEISIVKNQNEITVNSL